MNGKAFTILNPRSFVEIFSDYGYKQIYDFFSGIVDRNFFHSLIKRLRLEAFSLKCFFFFFNIENKMHLFRPHSFFNLIFFLIYSHLNGPSNLTVIDRYSVVLRVW